MSNWKDIKKEDINIDKNDIDILVGYDDMGNNYVTIDLDDMKDLIKKHDGKTK